MERTKQNKSKYTKQTSKKSHLNLETDPVNLNVFTVVYKITCWNNSQFKGSIPETNTASSSMDSLLFGLLELALSEVHSTGRPRQMDVRAPASNGSK